MANARKFKSIVTGALILAFGVIIGSGFTLKFLWEGFLDKMHRPPDPVVAIRHMKKELKLTDEQAEQILVVLNEEKDEMEAFHRKNLPILRERAVKFQKKIVSYMSKEQAEKFSKRFERMKEGILNVPPP